LRLLIKLELQKLFRRKYVVGGALILLAYTLFLFFGYGMHSRVTFPVNTEDDSLLEGRAAMLYNKEIYEQYAGELTDKNVAEILNDYWNLREKQEMEYSHLTNVPIIYEDFALFKVTDYDNNDRALSSYGNISINATDLPKFEKPLFFTFSYAWRTIFNILYNANIVFALFLLITIAPLFAEEYSSGADGVILTTRYGKSKGIYAKMVVALLVATLAVVAFALFVLLICGLYFNGLTGWQADVQTQFDSLLMLVPIRMNNLQFYLFAVSMYWLSAIGTAMLSCCCSAMCKKTFTACITSSVLYLIPVLPRQIGVVNEFVRECMLIFPVWASKSEQVLRTSEHKYVNLLPIACEMPIWIAIFTLFATIVLLRISYKSFSTHQVE